MYFRQRSGRPTIKTSFPENLVFADGVEVKALLWQCQSSVLCSVEFSTPQAFVIQDFSFKSLDLPRTLSKGLTWFDQTKRCKNTMFEYAPNLIFQSCPTPLYVIRLECDFSDSIIGGVDSPSDRFVRYSTKVKHWWNFWSRRFDTKTSPQSVNSVASSLWFGRVRRSQFTCVFLRSSLVFFYLHLLPFLNNA